MKNELKVWIKYVFAPSLRPVYSWNIGIDESHDQSTQHVSTQAGLSEPTFCSLPVYKGYISCQICFQSIQKKRFKHRKNFEKLSDFFFFTNHDDGFPNYSTSNFPHTNRPVAPQHLSSALLLFLSYLHQYYQNSWGWCFVVILQVVILGG